MATASPEIGTGSLGAVADDVVAVELPADDVAAASAEKPKFGTADVSAFAAVAACGFVAAAAPVAEATVGGRAAARSLVAAEGSACPTPVALGSALWLCACASDGTVAGFGAAGLALAGFGAFVLPLVVEACDGVASSVVASASASDAGVVPLACLPRPPLMPPTVASLLLFAGGGDAAGVATAITAATG